MLNLVAVHMEDPIQARAIAKIEPHSLAAFFFSGVLIVGSLLALSVASLDPVSESTMTILVGGMLAFVVGWIPLTLSLHGMCRLLGYRAEYGSLQTQVALALWPLAILPPVGLIQFLSEWDTKIIFTGTAAGVTIAIVLFLRQGIMANYGMRKAQANIALIGSFLLLGGFLGFLLAGIASGAVLLALASAILS